MTRIHWNYKDERRGKDHASADDIFLNTVATISSTNSSYPFQKLVNKEILNSRNAKKKLSKQQVEILK